MASKEYYYYKDIVDRHLLDFLPEIDKKSITLYEAMKYSLTAGGKRLRPVLLLASCDFAGGDVNQAIPYACALEYIHTYSLIHDDLPAMDDDDLRRGCPTNHKVYGDAIAILAGDGLLSSAFESMYKDMFLYFDDSAKLKMRINAAYEIARASGCRGMVAGQVADIESESKQCSKEMLDYIHLNKTAALIKASVRAGAQLAKAPDHMMTDLSEYGEYIGLAFQIADDILDVVGDEKIMGKKSGMDKEKNKAAYPSLYGLEASRARLAELTEKAVEVLKPYYDNAEFFVAVARDLEERTK